MDKILIVLSIAITISCGDSNKNSVPNISICKELDQVDREMLDAMDIVRDKFDTPENRKIRRNLVMTQVDWVQYRNSLVRAFWPNDPESYNENYRPCKCEFLMEMTRERIEVINLWIEGSTRACDQQTTINQKYLQKL